MADKPIGQLNEFPAGAPIDGTNTLLVAQYSNAAYKLTGQRFVNALADLLDGHGGIASIEYDEPASGSLVGTMTITLADETVTEIEISNGKGIVSVAKTGTSGYVDTYTISYNDGTTSTFAVTNGEKGDTGDAWYVHIRYAAHEPTADSDISSIPDAWIGIYSGTSSTAPTAYTAYAWYEFKGEKGDTGDDAQIDSVTAQYQYHTDGAVAPTGTWYNSVPAASAAVSGETQGKYLWSKIDIAYNNEQHCVFYNTAYQGIDGTGLTGVVKSINSTLVPDGNGNVAIDADAISAIPAPASPSDGAVLMYDSDDGWYAGDASSLGTVKSVNGKNPDGNGNVTVMSSDISDYFTQLWTNPNPGDEAASGFLEITNALSDWEIIIVESLLVRSNTIRFWTLLERGTTQVITFTAQSSDIIRQREIGFMNNASLGAYDFRIYDCYTRQYSALDSRTVDNLYIIPYKIYGIKKLT